MYTMACAMLWRYGYLDGLFQHLGHTQDFDIKYGDVKQIPKIVADVTDSATQVFAETILRFGAFLDSFSINEHGTGLDVVEEWDEV